MRPRFYFVLGFALFVAPLILYAISRFTGHLPSEEVWYSQGMNHGPWRWAWQHLFLGFPFLAPLITCISIIILALNTVPVRTMFGVLAIQLALAPIPLLVLVWTID